MIFYLSIAVYIGSVIAALVLMIAGRGMTLRQLLLLSATHGLFLVFFLITRLLADSTPSIQFPFLLFICSGTVLCGIVWRMNAPKPLRAYFSVFMLTFPLFLFSPSRFVNFLLTTKYVDSIGRSFPVKDAYYLEEQSPWARQGEQIAYKLIAKKGMFHQTLCRDLDFKGALDSIHILDSKKDSLQVRGFSHHTTFVSEQTDSTDIWLCLNPNRQPKIERKL